MYSLKINNEINRTLNIQKGINENFNSLSLSLNLNIISIYDVYPIIRKGIR